MVDELTKAVPSDYYLFFSSIPIVLMKSTRRHAFILRFSVGGLVGVATVPKYAAGVGGSPRPDF